MRQIVQDYLAKPDSKLLSKMTTEEQSYCKGQTPKKVKAPKTKLAPPKEENADS